VPGYIFTDKTDNTKVLFLPAIVAFDGNYNSSFSSYYPNFPYASDGNGYKTNYWNNNHAMDDAYGYSQFYQYNYNDGDPYINYESEALELQSIYYGLPIRAVAD
jgi:hypothetical protein